MIFARTGRGRPAMLRLDHRGSVRATQSYNAVAILFLLTGPIAAQENPARLEFDLAVINPANENKITAGSTSSSSFGGDRLELRGFTVKAMVKMAYRLQDYQIIGGPKWFDNDTYDVDAKSAPGGTQQQIPQKLQSLLADRFQLVLRRETRTLPAYALGPVKSGSKLKEAGPGAPPGGFGWGPRMIRSKGATMHDFAERLADALQHPVLDQTGLSGIYEIDLKFAPVEPNPSDTDPGPSIFQALQEQLGLKLDTTKGPVEVMVVDRLERPSAN